jgi:hypothetical protein
MPHARVSTYEFPTDRVDEAVPAFEEALGELDPMEGITEALLLVDRNSGKAMTITIWESEQALVGSEQEADEIRQRAASSPGGQVTDVARYEIALRKTL